MVPFQRVTIWLAAAFAIAGTISIAAYLLLWKPAGYLLPGAALAALCSVVSLLAGVISVSMEPVSRRRSGASRTSSAAAEAITDSALSAQFQQRREVLSERLNIDEPQFCSQAQATCTAWSFCGTAPDARALVTSPTTPEAQGGAAPQESPSTATPSRVLHRTGKPAACLALGPGAEAVSKPSPGRARAWDQEA